MGSSLPQSPAWDHMHTRLPTYTALGTVWCTWLGRKAVIPPARSLNLFLISYRVTALAPLTRHFNIWAMMDGRRDDGWERAARQTDRSPHPWQLLPITQPEAGSSQGLCEGWGPQQRSGLQVWAAEPEDTWSQAHTKAITSTTGCISRTGNIKACSG